MKREIFENRVRELAQFKTQHGHANPTPKNGSIGVWLSNVRSGLRGQGSLKVTPEEAQKLRAMGVRLITAAEERFEVLFAQLQEYKAIHGDILIPAIQRPLGPWVAKARKIAAGQIPPKLFATPEQWERLTQLGGADLACAGGQAVVFERRFKKLEAFKETHGHVDVPYNTPLWWWLAHIRYRLRKDKRPGILEKGRRGFITAQQLERLQHLGVQI